MFILVTLCTIAIYSHVDSYKKIIIINGVCQANACKLTCKICLLTANT